jgi:hypothetical protein
LHRFALALFSGALFFAMTGAPPSTPCFPAFADISGMSHNAGYTGNFDTKRITYLGWDMAASGVIPTCH